MFSLPNLGRIKNSLVFIGGEVRLKHDEPIRYTIPPVPEVNEQPVITNGKPDWRKCIGGCEKMFWSEGNDNRICPKCDKENTKEAEKEFKVKSFELEY